MAITTAICTSFKKELLEGTHNFTSSGDTFKVALELDVLTSYCREAFGLCVARRGLDGQRQRWTPRHRLNA